MIFSGQHRSDPGVLHHLGYHGRVGGHHQLVDHAVLADTLDNAGHQGFASQKAERFVRESG